MPPRRPKIKPVDSDASGGSSEETEEEFDWYNGAAMDDESYFCFTNNTREPLKVGDQAYYCYGNRSNRFLLLNYGFCFPGNKYDSYELGFKLDVDIRDPFVPAMIDFKGVGKMCQRIRFKSNILNDTLMSYLRSVLKQSFFANTSNAKIRDYGSIRRILLTRPVNLYFEKYCISYYSDILSYIKSNIEKSSSLEKDLIILNDQTLPYTTRMAIVYRSEKKKIIRN